MAERRTTEPNVGGNKVHSVNESSVGGSYSSDGRGGGTSRRSSSSTRRSSITSPTTSPADWADFNSAMFELPHIEQLPPLYDDDGSFDQIIDDGFQLSQANVADRWLPGWLPGFYDVINNWKNWY